MAKKRPRRLHPIPVSDLPVGHERTIPFPCRLRILAGNRIRITEIANPATGSLQSGIDGHESSLAAPQTPT